MAKIVITASPDGLQTKIDAIGFTGDECLLKAQGYEEALMPGDAERELKAEYYENVSEGQTEAESEREMA